MNKDKIYHILLTHDGSSQQLDRICETLKEKNIKLTRVPSIEDSCSIIKNGPRIDLLIICFESKSTDRWRFIRILRSPELCPAHTFPLVIVSDSLHNIPRALPELRADAHFDKHFEESTLKSTVKRLLVGKDLLTGPTILVIENDTEERGNIARTLKKSGFRVFEAHTGEDALNIFHKHKPAFILCSDRISDTSVVSLIQIFKTSPHSSKIIILSKNPSAQVLLDGADAYIKAPYSIESLLNLVDTVTMEHTLATMSNEVIKLKEEFDQQNRYIKELRVKLKKTQDQFTTAQKLETVSAVTEGAVHNFCNLLTSINGLVSIMQIKRSPDDQDYAYLELIHDASMRADELLRQLLSMSYNQNIEKRPLCLNIYIKNIVNIMEKCIDQPIEFCLDLQKDLASILADPGQIEQVIMNLCINSCHAIAHEGRIFIKTAQKGKNVCMTISDNGHGMDDATMTHIFEPYFTTKEKGKGTGLGLSSVANIIEDHQGHIEVSSTLGKGTRFKIYFPICRCAAEEDKNTTLPLKKGSGTILVIDDEELLRDTLKDLLTHIGYHVLVAEDGSRGLTVFMEHADDIDLVIIDMNMPVMNGFDACCEIKKINPLIKILLTTGHNLAKNKHMLLNEGIHGFLQKPFTVGDLSKEIERIISP
ncbi:MAG: response regulator [bacterium]